METIIRTALNGGLNGAIITGAFLIGAAIMMTFVINILDRTHDAWTKNKQKRKEERGDRNERNAYYAEPLWNQHNYAQEPEMSVLKPVKKKRGNSIDISIPLPQSKVGKWILACVLLVVVFGVIC